MKPPTDILGWIGEIAEESELEYALIGGHAVNIWLEPRFTADIDLTVAWDGRALERFRAKLEEAGYRVEVAHGKALPSGPDFIRFVRASAEPPIEIQIAKTDYQERTLERAQRPSGIAVATVEDLIVLKLIANRPRDRGDLDGLLHLPGLDFAYIEETALDWGVEEVLAALRPDREGSARQ